jgi:hypothetical protein
MVNLTFMAIEPHNLLTSSNNIAQRRLGRVWWLVSLFMKPPGVNSSITGSMNGVWAFCGQCIPGIVTEMSYLMLPMNIRLKDSSCNQRTPALDTKGEWISDWADHTCLVSASRAFEASRWFDWSFKVCSASKKSMEYYCNMESCRCSAFVLLVHWSLHAPHSYRSLLCRLDYPHTRGTSHTLTTEVLA